MDKKFTATITYTVVHLVEIEAPSLEAADEQARKMAEYGKLPDTYGDWDYDVKESV
ncbi:MAG: hypothetical protein PHE17_14945 [Thiothrix sp.]|uniref:hypothetical protein n=1 Tax=Thiothrix sp. TaxID=1032 RepID=UPI00261278F2|nr:hypothetical protein [Thiothrix sp.]MDD5394309.1 hypothetical protein [Thiothrix sp.]